MSQTPKHEEFVLNLGEFKDFLLEPVNGCRRVYDDSAPGCWLPDVGTLTHAVVVAPWRRLYATIKWEYSDSGPVARVSLGGDTPFNIGLNKARTRWEIQ